MNNLTKLRLVPSRRLLSIALAMGMGLALAACGDDDDGDAAPDEEPGNGVGYLVDEIAYTDVTAPVGGTIEIDNTSGVPHTFTADEGREVFHVEYGADETATVVVPDEPGEHPFHCEIHPQMTATLTVE